MSDIGLARNGVTETTAKSILLGAGTIYKNLAYDVSTKKWNGSPVGATQGGNKISIANELTQIEVDDVLVAVRDLEFKTSQSASLEVNLIELSKESLKMALLMEEDTEASSEDYDVLTMKGALTNDDYLENIAFVGFKTDNLPIVIILENAICTSGLETDAKPKEGAVSKLTFESRGDISDGLDKLPVKIYIAKEPASSGAGG